MYTKNCCQIQRHYNVVVKECGTEANVFEIIIDLHNLEYYHHKNIFYFIYIKEYI